jgi:hypothetical protein
VIFGLGEVPVIESVAVALPVEVVDAEGGKILAGALAAFSLNAVAVCVVEGLRASIAP